jgi:hypothetical protein
MAQRRNTWGPTVRLAATLSVVAALVAASLNAIGDVSVITMVVVVSIVGFVTSWIQSGRSSSDTAAVARRAGSHRITSVPARRHAA